MDAEDDAAAAGRVQSGHRGILKLFLAATFILGFIFVFLQAEEYVHAYQEMNLKLKERFDAEGISFAFPTQTLYVKQVAG